MRILLRGLYVAEKAVLAMSLLAVTGIVGDMGSSGFITLEDYRMVILFAIILGFALGASYGLFDLDHLDIKYAYAIHFSIGYIVFNAVEGLMIKGSIVPTYTPVEYLQKLFWYGLAYGVFSIVEYVESKWKVDKMNQKINELKSLA